MKEMIFATVNGNDITGYDILSCKKRMANETPEEEHSFANTPNEQNNSYLNIEALQRLIDNHCLIALAKFEGIEVSEEDISEAIMELRSSYEDEVEWETAIDDLGIDDKNMRSIFYIDMMIERLLQSHLEHFEAPDNHKAEEFYNQNIDSMKISDTYTFIEIEVEDTSFFKIAATILSQDNTDLILKEAKQHHLDAKLNESIPYHLLPTPLQGVFKDLQEGKIGTIPLEEGSVVFVKLLQKIEGKTLSLDDALPGLIEYLNYQQNKDLLDELTERSLDQCDIKYFHTDLIKNLK